RALAVLDRDRHLHDVLRQHRVDPDRHGGAADGLGAAHRLRAGDDRARRRPDAVEPDADHPRLPAGAGRRAVAVLLYRGDIGREPRLDLLARDRRAACLDRLGDHRRRRPLYLVARAARGTGAMSGAAAAAEAGNRPLAGIMWIVAAIALLSMMDAIGKWVLASL